MVVIDCVHCFLAGCVICYTLILILDGVEFHGRFVVGWFGLAFCCLQNFGDDVLERFGILLGEFLFNRPFQFW